MDSGDYLILTGAALALALAVAAFASSPRKKPQEAPKEITRWKRFRVRPGPLFGTLAEPKAVIEEEPKGLKVVAAARSKPFPVQLRLKDDVPFHEISRKWRPMRWAFRVRVGDGASLEVVVPKKGAKTLSLRNPPGGPRFEIRGSPLGPEYQILKNGRLVCIADRSSADGPGKEYTLEVLKTEDPLPILRLALTLEVASA